MPQTLRYRSGEEIRKGDRVLFHGNPAEVEFVAIDAKDPELTWYVEKYAGGVMIVDPVVSGRSFIEADSIPNCEDLQFVSRA